MKKLIFLLLLGACADTQPSTSRWSDAGVAPRPVPADVEVIETRRPHAQIYAEQKADAYATLSGKKCSIVLPLDSEFSKENIAYLRGHELRHCAGQGHRVMITDSHCSGYGTPMITCTEPRKVLIWFNYEDQPGSYNAINHRVQHHEHDD